MVANRAPHSLKQASLLQLSEQLGYTFRDHALLKQALTHRSASLHHNERLEFLGDSVLNLAMSTWLFHHFPTASEGQLTCLRAGLVQEASLVDLARPLHLGSLIKFGPGERKTKGGERASTLADTLEAVIGAIYLDGGWLAIQGVLDKLFHDKLNPSQLATHYIDYKTQLQEWCQAHKYALPVYTVQKIIKNAIAADFYVRCEVPGLDLFTEGIGSSKRKASRAAAQAFLSKCHAND